MSPPRRVDIRKQSCLFDDFFKINELVVSHQRADGTMSAEQRRLVFERGDSAAVLLFNRDSKQLVLVNQFKAPTLGKGHANGWITETVAGMVDHYETPAAAAARETLEETGYKIGGLTEIATFFSSPGGSSERIFLYYSEVGEADQLGKGGGDADEDIEVQHIPVHELLEQLQHKSLEDPKLIISALWLKEELNKQAQRPLDHATVKYALAQHPDLYIGYKTGPIVEVKDVNIWVNSENEDMIMDRFIGRSISANIRYLGADRDRSNNVTEDLINDELANAVGQLARVRIGEVIETGSGTLAATHGVKSILHVATVRGVGAGQGVKADLDDLALCTRNVLMKARERNQRWRNIKRIFGMKDCRSILIPILGAGDGGLAPVLVAPRLISAAIKYYNENPKSTLKEIYFLAFTGAHKSACDRELDRLCKRGVIKPIEYAQ